jgi:hypothetical protein
MNSGKFWKLDHFLGRPLDRDRLLHADDPVLARDLRARDEIGAAEAGTQSEQAAAHQPPRGEQCTGSALEEAALRHALTQQIQLGTDRRHRSFHACGKSPAAVHEIALRLAGEMFDLVDRATKSVLESVSSSPSAVGIE